jgi:hypothetical protein
MLLHVYIFYGRSLAACCSASRLVAVNISQEISWDRSFPSLRRQLYEYLLGLSYLSVCVADLVFCLVHRTMDRLYWLKQPKKGNRPWWRSFCWLGRTSNQQTRWVTALDWMGFVATWRSICLWRIIPFRLLLCDKNHLVHYVVFMLVCMYVFMDVRTFLSICTVLNLRMYVCTVCIH